MDKVVEITVSWALGAVTAIITTAAIEKLRQPWLKLKLSQPKDASYPDSPAKTSRGYARHMNFPAKQARFLTLAVENVPLPWWARWLQRNAASQCCGELRFLTPDGQQIFATAMPMRWCESPEPLPSFALVEGKRFEIYDPEDSMRNEAMTIFPGETKEFDVAAKFDNEEACYGWTTANYGSDPVWRNPAWKIPEGHFLVNVSLWLDGRSVRQNFKLINYGVGTNFRLETEF